MRHLKNITVRCGDVTHFIAVIAMAGFFSGCATRNLADNPVNRAAGVLASALAGVNRTVARGIDSMDRNLMHIQYSPAGAANEYFMSAELGTRQETGAGPNPDTTYRPALASKANAVCKGQFRLLNERNPQASIAFQRLLVEKRIEREMYNRTGTGGYGVPEISSFDRLLLNTYPEAGLVWHIRCGEGQGWSAPPPPKFDITTVPNEYRARVATASQISGRVIGNIPALPSPLYTRGLLLVPSEIAMKEIILGAGESNPQGVVVLWSVIADGLARGVQRRKIFDQVDIREASVPSESSDSVVVHFTPNELTVAVPNEAPQVVLLNKENYNKFVVLSSTAGMTAEEGMELVVRVVEDAARRATKNSGR